MPDQVPNEIDLFVAAAELPSDQRADFLDKVCGANGELRDRISRYLSAHERPGPLDAPAPQVDATLQLLRSHDAIGTHIGPYKIREQIGEGGMGEVYVAEPAVRVGRRSSGGRRAVPGRRTTRRLPTIDNVSPEEVCHT